MVKKRIGRSVRKNQNRIGESEEVVQAPHSFVINKGITDGNVAELTKDFRKVMEPYTATQLKVNIPCNQHLYSTHHFFFSDQKEEYNKRFRIDRWTSTRITHFSLFQIRIGTLFEDCQASEGAYFDVQSL